MQIQPLYLVPHYAEQVTDWFCQAFGTPESRDFYASIVASSQCADELPLTFVATHKEKLLGTVGLWRCDLISRQDLYPWLAALYIEESQRGKGLGGELQKYVIDYVRKLGLPQLYLYSACQNYYERFGWQYIGEAIDYPNKRVYLYQYIL